MGCGERDKEGTHRPEFYRRVGVGGLRARARRLPAGNQFLGRAHREREGGEGGQARREGGAARGLAVHRKMPGSVVRVEVQGSTPVP